MKHFKNIHLGRSTIAVTGLGGSVVPKTIKIEINDTDISKENEVVPWGGNNLYPQDFYNKKFIKNGSAVGGLNALKATHYGTGIQIVKEVKNETSGKIDLVPQFLNDHPEVKAFFRDNKINHFIYSKITDLSLWNISFTEHVISVNFEKIVKTKRHKAAHCRFAPQDKTGTIPFVYINTDWSNYKASNTAKITYMDPELTPAEIKAICKDKKIYQFMTATIYPMVDESYYPKTEWHAVDRSGWMDIANSIPELKKAIFERQLDFKYIIYVSDFYFESFYKDEWESFDSDKRQKLREELSTAIDEHFSGNKNAGGSLISPIFEDGGKFVKGIEITEVGSQLKEGVHLPDASASNMEILFSMGVDPVIVGAMNVGSNQGRSGSDKREAYTILAANLTPRRHYTVDDFELWRDYNGWDTDLLAVFPSVNLTTLDKNPNGQTTVING